MYKKYLMVKDNAFPIKSRVQGWPLFTCPIQYSTGNSSSYNKAGKRNKRHTERKQSDCFLWRWQDCLCQNSKGRVLVAHACNPSYSGGIDPEDHGSKPAQAKKKNHHKKVPVEWLKMKALSSNLSTAKINK
jgi:hypothetical protein